MKITGVEAIHMRIPVVENKADGSQEVVVVRVDTDAGLSGYGEVVSNSTVARAIIEAPMSAPFRHGLGAVLMGTDPLDPEARWREMYFNSSWYGRRGAAIHAMAGIDTALWDIVGKAAGKPCCEIWGRRRDRVRAYCSVLFPDTPDQAAENTAGYRRKGFTAVKFGWNGFGLDHDRDRAMMDAIGKAAGDDMDIMVDVGRVWDADTAIERSRELFDEHGVVWVEEPLHQDDYDGYARLAADVDGRIATGETEDAIEVFERLMDGGVKVIQPDVGRAGGLTICRKLSEIAFLRNVWCIPHCFGTGVQLAASIQWAISAPDMPVTEYPVTESPLRNELVIGLPRLENGFVVPSDRPGIGIEIDDSVVERYRVP